MRKISYWKKNKFPYEIGSDEQIQDNQPEPEENSEETHQQRHGKKWIKSRSFHSIDSALDPGNYGEISYLNKYGHWKRFVGYLGPESNKETKKDFLVE